MTEEWEVPKCMQITVDCSFQVRLKSIESIQYGKCYVGCMGRWVGGVSWRLERELCAR